MALGKNNLCRLLLTHVVLAVVIGHSHAVTQDPYQCGPGLSTPGVTIPKGDIIVEYGNPLEIYCVLSPEYVAKGRNSSQLEFERQGVNLPSEYVHIVNETTVRLYIKKPPLSSGMYYCKLKDKPGRNSPTESVCLNSVAVGTKPEEVQNFTCTSNNWDNLTCTWDPPLNYVKTTYKLYFYMPGRAGARHLYSCPTNTRPNTPGKEYRENSCFWDQRTSVAYRQPYEDYIFIISGENSFGNITQRIRFHHYANVVPAKAANLTILEKTTHSAQIQWEIVFPMQNFPPGVVQKVEYQSQWDARDHWQVVNTSHLNIKNSIHRLNMTDLKYANTFYDIRVFMRSAANLPGQERWSQPATITVKTKDTVPGAPPKTDFGSFEVTAGLFNRDVYLYWQQIPEYMANGEHFGYKVIYVLENGVPRNISASEITKTYAVFRGISLNSFLFGIASSNKKGISAKSSEIFVPAQSEIFPEPVSFTKIAFKNSIYELSWKPPLKSNKIVSYTIFWCDSKMDRPFQCTGILDWIKVQSNETIKNITVPEDKIYQFAISANSLTESSGMVWASCTVIHDRGIGKMKSFWINRIGARFIELGWKLECSDRIGVVTGFRIYYCPIVEPRKMDCKGGDLMNTTIHGDSNTIHGNITGLIPYTTYKVAIIVLTKSGGQGQPSDYQFNTTLEASPDMPPQNVHITNVTNTSMIVSWLPPPSMNGVLRYYQVHYNDEVFRLEGTLSTAVLTKARIVNLSSFTNYSVSVSACTISCSIKSPPVYVNTAIGRPGIMDAPTVKFNNFSIVLYWKPPVYSAGHLDYYQVMVQQSDDKHNASTYIYNSSDTQKQIDIEDCKAEPLPRTYRVSVRAVNFDVRNVSLPGPWSNAGEGSCYVTGPSKIVLAIIWMFVVLVLSLIIVFISRRVWHRCKEMQNVQVTLPPGLASTIEKEKDQEYHVQMHWPKPQRTEVEHKSQNAADQELLLQKKKNHLREGENDRGSIGDGDSSGCSSGHDSVSSSLTSGTHISTDSGTEADHRAPSPDGVFTNSGIDTCDTSGSQADGGEPCVLLANSNSSLAQSAPNLNERGGSDFPFLGYCRVGGSPTKQGVTLGYVSLSPSSPFLQSPPPALSNGYVSHPPCWGEMKEQPMSIPSVPVASKGYIMAGAPDTASPSSYCRLGWEKPHTYTYNDYVPHRQLDFNR